MADVTTFYATVAGIMLLGFLGFLLFQKTRISDVLVLIAAGYVVGPVLGVFDVGSFQDATPYIATLALAVILFDGGLNLRLPELMRGLARSTVLGTVGFLLTVAVVTVVGHYLLRLDWVLAALLGCVLGGTSSIVVIPLVQRLGVSERTRVLVSVESALTDVLCVVGALALITMIQLETLDAVAGMRQITAQFSIAIVMGLAAGAAWTQVMRFTRKTPYAYMLTLAAILGLFAFTDFNGGNGAIAVLLFGIVLGNSDILSSVFRVQAVGFDQEMRRFQGEISFLIRVFFFVYLGVILSPLVLTGRFLLDGIVILCAIILARWLATRLVTRGDDDLKADENVIFLLMPRGLAAAVLASIPVTAGIAGAETFVEWAFLIIVLTNVVATVVALVPKHRAVVTVPVTAPGDALPTAAAPEAAAEKGP